MSIHFEQPKLKRDWVSAVMHGVLAAVESMSPTGPNIHNVVLQLNDALKAVAGKETDTPSNRAWNWAVQTLTYASGDILAQSRRLAPLAPGKEDAVTVFLEAATQFGNAQLDQATLRAPSLSAVFEPARKALPELLQNATTGQSLQLETLKIRFDRALQAASNRVICDNPSYFKPLEDALVSVGGELARREAGWARHTFWISSQFTDAPVFSPDADETVPLASVYLRLRCFWNEEIPIKKGDRDHQEFKRTAHVADLHETLHAWLEGNASADPVRVVAGGPGCGKSSFARAFAHELALDTNKHRVALIRLQHTHLTGQLDRDIAEYFHKVNTPVAHNGNPGLPQSPLEWRKEDATPLLLIFDGLDELTADAGDAEKYARDFLLSLLRILQPLNTDGPPVRAVVLGRNIACEQAMKAAGLPLPKMLNVATIAPMTRQTCLLSKDPPEGEIDLFAPENLMQIDQRKTYWQQWAQAKALNPDTVPEAVTHDDMSELNLEPLLLHLLINSKYCGAEWQQAADNRNLVYEDILEKIFERNNGKGHFAAHNITRDDFFDLMEVLGLAAWRGNGRTGNEEEFRIVRKLHLERERHFKTIGAASLKTVALNIHTRPGGASDKDGFEFIHKSFGEYLAARGLLSHAHRVADKLADEKEPGDLAAPWSELIAGAELTPYFLRFLYDETRHTLTPKDAAYVKEGLTEMLNWVIEHGFPVAVTFPGLSWRNLETHQRCAESALLAAASASASIIPLDPKKREGGLSPTIDINTTILPNSPVALVSRLMFATDMGARSVFQRINLSRANLRMANLSGADLRGANLSWADLSGANLIEADLRGAYLRGAYLRKANLSGANLIEADLRGADLRGANLTEAILRGANLIDADLRGADLRMANLSGADLRMANLREADLRRAFMIEVDLRRADLSGADLIEANLRMANLREANLSGADLRMANLSRADLTEANLREVDLSGADLSSAKCSRLRIDSCRLHFANLEDARSLTQDQINSALGNESTRLPDGLTHPENWTKEAG